MTGFVLPIVEAVFPREADRAARRAAVICILLALFVGFLFPLSARAGTETASARWTTTGALLLAGVLFHFSGGRLAVVVGAVALLVAGSFVAPAGWLLLLGGGACVYVAIAMVPRPERRVAEIDREPRLEAAQEMIESLATALVLALVVREFGFEAFKIPTGSMQPTILGDGGNRQGDRLLAFKPIEFRRWDIVVFKFPLFRNTNYIKRLIGLPGEHVELREGDVYVDGAIASKPDDVQEVMWRREFAPGPDADWAREFEDDETGRWKLGRGQGASAAGGDQVAWIQAKRSFQDDLRFSFDAEVPGESPSGELLVSVEGAGRRCDLVIGADGAYVLLPGAEGFPEGQPAASGTEVPGLSLASFRTGARIGFAMSDRVARVHLDGRLIASIAHADVTNRGLRNGRARIGTRNLAAVVRNAVGENDVQYSEQGSQAWEIPVGRYVMLGDNTTQSKDSRLWTAHEVRTKDGRTFVAPSQARVTEERDEVVFKRRPDGGIDFLDSYGIAHAFAKDEYDLRENVPQPFVHEADLVGRAFLIFFPLRSEGEFRPRFLR